MSQRNSKKREAARKKKQRLVHHDAAGRVHLSVHRDPSTGQEFVALLKPLFKEDWQNEVTAAAANTARALLGEVPDAARAVALARNAMAATSRLAEGLLARAPKGSVACRAGCDHCCYQVVGVTFPEALAIFVHLSATRSTLQLEALAEHVAMLQARVSGLPSRERFSPEHPCPFLQAGQCSIYEVRPLACRGMNSLDAGECADRLRNPESRAEFLRSGVGARSFMEPIRAFHAISAGMQLSLSELYQLDMSPLELTAIMHVLLSQPTELIDQWLAGQSPFESARARDKSSDPGMLEVSGVRID